MNNKTIVIIPTYNEVENISRIIDLIISENQHIDVLVVDDNSPDDTASLVVQKQNSYPDRVFLIKLYSLSDVAPCIPEFITSIFLPMIFSLIIC